MGTGVGAGGAEGFRVAIVGGSGVGFAVGAGVGFAGGGGPALTNRLASLTTYTSVPGAGA